MQSAAVGDGESDEKQVGSVSTCLPSGPAQTSFLALLQNANSLT